MMYDVQDSPFPSNKELHDAEFAFTEIRHSYSTFPLKTAVPN